MITCLHAIVRHFGKVMFKKWRFLKERSYKINIEFFGFARVAKDYTHEHRKNGTPNADQSPQENPVRVKKCMDTVACLSTCV